ncbi:oligosaccharyl transferase, archaeosortase A system-associated [Halorhabdus sp. CBA1104]|uniref:oligosaccharyl transferase, archaeosortase A system-associated n=1 Tax=Halorhabdus sp. CBA1104 TaxID=1380432 RepID=UPI0012B338A2|nr:oligosaccharyl transferase, archaeosortase A system-associated [Halorhabdus sp. CBA1104]QGN06529.1 oligosaccharyl transferase, archaeosortase A system-associated [Halorhabdus sp. CBA1104]
MSVLEKWPDDETTAGQALGWLSQWYHLFVVAGLFGFMFWLRARTWENFIVNGDVLFSGNDAWYEFREVAYAVANWPNTMPFDPWTEFPTGVVVEQFGTFYDQLIATTALIVGLGNPSDHLIRLVHLFFPALLGAAVVIPTYYLGKHVGGRIGGVIAAVLVALSGGEFLRRSLVGFSDHHVAEVFFQALAVLAILIALRVAQEEKPIYELFTERDWDGLRRPLGWAVIAGVALGLYISIWPPGVLLIGILGVYVTIQLPITYLRKESPEHISIVAAVIFLVAAVLSLASIDEIGFGMISRTLAQPGLAIAGAVWVGVLSALARAWDERDLSRWVYPVVVFGSLLGAVLLAALLLPDFFQYFLRQALRFVGFAFNPHTDAAVTIGEVQPLPIGQADTLISWLGVAPIVGGIGVLLALAHQYVADELDPAYLFVALWFAFFVAATFTQQRFAYYLTVPAAVMTALVVTRLFRYLRSISDTDGIETYEALVVGGVIVLLVVPMALGTTAIGRSASNGPGGVTGWQSSLDYIEEETPAVGNYGDAGNADQLDFYGTYERTDDFEYPDGAYGVMSWWDYGHWITQEGERIPVANPFQHNAREAAAFLVAQNETDADDALAAVGESETDAQTRYVMVDWKMATANGGFGGYRWGKFFAPPNFLDDADESDYYRRVRSLVQTQQGQSLTNRYFTLQKQAYYETMAVRLYRYHGSAASPTDVPGLDLGGSTVVVDWQDYQGVALPELSQNGTGQTVQLFQNRSAAEEFVANDSTSQIGGIGKIPSESVGALQHYRLVQVSDPTVGLRYGQLGQFMASQPGLTVLSRSQQYQTGVGIRALGLAREPFNSYTKVFERVPGATVQGDGPSNATVTAAVEMEMPNANKTFTYRQHAETDANGEFTMTLPYSTEGYENWGPEDGYTNVSVRANSSYQFSTETSFNESGSIYRYTATENVSEAQVNGVEDEPVAIELERQVLGEFNNSESSDAGNESSESLTPPSLRSPDGDTDDSPSGQTGEAVSWNPVLNARSAGL